MFSFVETPLKFIIAELSIRKLGSSSVLIIYKKLYIESSAIINLHGVSTKLNKYVVFTMQTYKKLKNSIIYKTCRSKPLSHSWVKSILPSYRACYLIIALYFGCTKLIQQHSHTILYVFINT